MSSLPTTPVLDTKNANQIDNELCMRRTILAIHNDPSFTSAQKAQKMQVDRPHCVSARLISPRRN